jgi:putative ABC transport system permease protein
MKTPTSGRVNFLRTSVGIEPGSYPLLGEVELRSGATLADVLRETGDIVVTRDLAESRGLEVGDTVLIGNQLGGVAEPLRVVDVATSTPNMYGESAYYDMSTAAELLGHPAPVTDVYVVWDEDAVESGAAAEARASLVDAGWQVYAPDTINPSTLEMWDTFSLMLKGSGIMGLMVGGIGIANTMQVLLRRRREEVGVLKALGYARNDILLLFTVETALIGLVGSFLGAGAGVGLSAVLTGVVSNVVVLFLNWSVRPAFVAGGVAVGVVTTVLFAANAILRASDVRPSDVFRQLPLPTRAPGRLRNALRSVATFAVMAVPFGAIASLVLGSVWKGALVLGAAVLGLIVVGGLLAGIKWLILRLLPVGRLHMLRMARNNMRRRGFSLVFAMIALCIGSFTLGLATVVIRGSQEQFELRMLSDEGYNLVVLSDPRRVDVAVEALAGETEVGVRYEVALAGVSSSTGVDLSRELGLGLQGRETPWDVVVDGAAWGSVPGGAYLPADLDGALEALEVTGPDGESLTLPVVGSYEGVKAGDRQLLSSPRGVLVDVETALSFGGEGAGALVAAAVPPARLDEAAAEVGAAVPELMVLTTGDVNDAFNATFKSLFTFAMLMSGLALVAGAVLIANAVSMAMIERRYEMGVMKAVGYRRDQVLRALLFEYGLVSAIAGGVGLVGVTAFIFVLTRLQEVMAGVVTVGPGSALLIVGVAVGLTLLSVLAAAWKPTSLRPVVVLRE